MVEDGQTWFMKWQETVSEGVVDCNCIYHYSPKLKITEEKQIFSGYIRRTFSVASVSMTVDCNFEM